MPVPSELPVVYPVPGALSDQDWADMAYHCAAHCAAHGLDVFGARELMEMIGVGRQDVELARMQLKARLLTQLSEELGLD